MFERTPAAAVSHESSTHETFAARTASPPLVGLPGHGRASEAHFSGDKMRQVTSLSQVCLLLSKQPIFLLTMFSVEVLRCAGKAQGSG